MIAHALFVNVLADFSKTMAFSVDVDALADQHMTADDDAAPCTYHGLGGNDGVIAYLKVATIIRRAPA